MAFLSSRGRGLQDFYPPYFEIFDDPWDPDTNPNGYLNLGVAENVRQVECSTRQPQLTSGIDFDAARDEKIH